MLFTVHKLQIERIKIFQTKYLDMMQKIKEVLPQSVFTHLTMA